MWTDFVDGLGGIVSNVWDKLGDWFSLIISKVLMLLPDSPFIVPALPASVRSALGVINWLVPVSYIVGVTSAWAVAIAIYYAYSVIMRKLGAID